MMDILHELEEARVISFEFANNALYVEECCDRWFGYKLNKAELGELIEALQGFYNKMEW